MNTTTEENGIVTTRNENGDIIGQHNSRICLPEVCGCGHCSPSVEHKSDCAVHNAPALPVGLCDCGAVYVAALDALGIALVGHRHKWSDKERWLYEEAIRLANVNWARLG
ncbi:MAG: hypothetical protein ACOYM3_06160 [Terrimicrobiaceae bacterium]